VCGFAFPAQQVVAPAVHAIPAAWYPEPGDATKERYWDGLSWTQNIRPVGGQSADSSTSAIASILKYPEGFDQAKHCSNCGLDLVDAKCSNC